MSLTSIIIPTYQHAHVLRHAIDSALAQTADVEVIVVDDGSTDDTQARLVRVDDPRVRVITLPHGGPSVSRNAGIDAARGEYVQFLDADDIIAPTKVAEQFAAFDDTVGWVLCDTCIQDAATGRETTASRRYDYERKSLGGWIGAQLAAANFIPIMSPLVRRSVLGDHIRFRDELVPEDWHFWCAVAGAARVRYLPLVLATYRKSRTGRSRTPKAARFVMPNIEQPLRLNLGCGTQGKPSWHPLRGFVNLDKSLGWRFEDGLGDFVTGSVAGITISHALMFVALADWPAVFLEFARVLKPGGVLRITEDDATNSASSRYGGWKGSESAVTLTDAAMVREHMERAGLTVYDVDATTTRYADKSLMQAQHGTAPDVFFAEGARPMAAVLFSPHNDDETLFAAFTILRYRPMVVVCYGSSGDYGDTATRVAETRDAMTVLGGDPVEQWNGGDIAAQMRALDERIRPTRVWAPSNFTSHPDHLAVAVAAAEVFGDRLTRYHTYQGLTRYHTYHAGGKVRLGTPVEFEAMWIQTKMRALCRYDSQIRHLRANQFFCADMYEYYDDE